MFNIQDYNYELPPELIAQTPLEVRDHSRLLLADRSTRAVSDYFFFDLPRLLRKGDLLVVNDTRVIPARIFGVKESGGRVEVLVLDHFDPERKARGSRYCLLRSSKRPKKGGFLFFEEEDISGRIEDVLDAGLVRIEFIGDRSIDSILEEKGHMPLPPYIKREDPDIYSSYDRERYQTVYATERGAVAAPTAGLHFTRELIERLRVCGISLAPITLHVGHGTFRPVRTRDIRNHKLGSEFYRINKETAERVSRARKTGGRIVAVGTTVVRALESASGEDGRIYPCETATDLLITPGYHFKIVDAIITNFHLPKSSLLFLVSAFAGVEFIREIYKWAVERKYRFYSYGDAMLIE